MDRDEGVFDNASQAAGDDADQTRGQAVVPPGSPEPLRVADRPHLFTI